LSPAARLRDASPARQRYPAASLNRLFFAPCHARHAPTVQMLTLMIRCRFRPPLRGVTRAPLCRPQRHQLPSLPAHERAMAVTAPVPLPSACAAQRMSFRQRAVHRPERRQQRSDGVAEDDAHLPRCRGMSAQRAKDRHAAPRCCRQRRFAVFHSVIFRVSDIEPAAAPSSSAFAEYSTLLSEDAGFRAEPDSRQLAQLSQSAPPVSLRRCRGQPGRHCQPGCQVAPPPLSPSSAAAIQTP